MEPFEECIRLLLELHALMKAEKGDSEEAQELRERMEAPHHALSEQESWLLSLISETLYGDDMAKEHLIKVFATLKRVEPEFTMSYSVTPPSLPK